MAVTVYVKTAISKMWLISNAAMENYNIMLRNVLILLINFKLNLTTRS